MALVVLIIHTVTRLTVNADRPAGMLEGADIGIPRTFPGKALTAGIASALRMFSSHRYLAFTAAFTFVVYAVVHTAV